MLNSFKGFIYPSNEPLCGTVIINLAKKLYLCMLLQANQKHHLQELNKNAKKCLSNLSMNNCIYLLRQQS